MGPRYRFSIGTGYPEEKWPGNFGQKLEDSKISFFHVFFIFLVFARRFLLDFRGLGPPPGLIFSFFFCDTPFLLVFLIVSGKKTQKFTK